MIARDLAPGARFYFVAGYPARGAFNVTRVTTTEPRAPVSYYDRQPVEAVTTIACTAQVFNVPASTPVEIAS